MSQVVKRRKPAAQLRHQGKHPIGECARCHQTVPIACRRLCDACYYHVRKDGQLADYPTTHHHWQPAELLVEYELLKSAGNTDEVIASRLGYRKSDYLRDRIAYARTLS